VADLNSQNHRVVTACQTQGQEARYISYLNWYNTVKYIIFKVYHTDIWYISFDYSGSSTVWPLWLYLWPLQAYEQSAHFSWMLQHMWWVCDTD
jgi:hypothetical protein